MCLKLSILECIFNFWIRCDRVRVILSWIWRSLIRSAARFEIFSAFWQCITKLFFIKTRRYFNIHSMRQKNLSEAAMELESFCLQLFPPSFSCSLIQQRRKFLVIGSFPYFYTYLPKNLGTFIKSTSSCPVI